MELLAGSNGPQRAPPSRILSPCPPNPLALTVATEPPCPCAGLRTRRRSPVLPCRRDRRGGGGSYDPTEGAGAFLQNGVPAGLPRRQRTLRWRVLDRI